MPALCHICVDGFLFRDDPNIMDFPELATGEGYGECGLENAIDFCQAYLDEGLTHEPIQEFDLREFIEWARKESARVAQLARA
jgi:hypothetical protein